jgi:hypothetical protein
LNARALLRNNNLKYGNINQIIIIIHIAYDF